MPKRALLTTLPTDPKPHPSETSSAYILLEPVGEPNGRLLTLPQGCVSHYKKRSNIPPREAFCKPPPPVSEPDHRIALISKKSLSLFTVVQLNYFGHQRPSSVIFSKVVGKCQNVNVTTRSKSPTIELNGKTFWRRLQKATYHVYVSNIY